MHTDLGPEAQLREAVERILRSTSRKKLIVAGPGTGKTSVFQELLACASGDRKTRLVLTFINNLRNDLDETLHSLASVATLHSYCQSLLHRKAGLRGGLTSEFSCLPRLSSLIATDWEVLCGSKAPPFVEKMQDLVDDDETAFYLARGSYYDAVDFDDSVFRAYLGLVKGADVLDGLDLVLIDEFQDFNSLEKALIDLLAERNPIVVAGDDDQALYSQLRGASCEFIRSMHKGGEYEVFELPFCLRCPEVIVHAVNDVIERAKHLKKLDGRIDKPYRPYAPLKAADSERYPHISLVETTVQRKKTNYMGRYIASEVAKIPEAEVEEAHRKNIAAALVIGARHYLRQIGEHLSARGFTLDTRRDAEISMTRETGLEILAADERSNLGWRVVLEFENEEFRAGTLSEADAEGKGLVETLPPEFREKVLQEAGALAVESADVAWEANEGEQLKGPLIKLTSFEGAKGLSAQHVYIVGMHEGELPHDESAIQDIEICRFIVGLTRARKKCSLVCTRNFAGEWKQPSPFLSWINDSRYEVVKVDRAYWEHAASQ